MLKICTKCKRELDIEKFGKDKKQKDELNLWCKECKNKSNMEYYEKNKEEKVKWQKNYREEHRDKINKRSKEYYKDNLEKEKERQRRYRDENPEKRREANKRYRKNNLEKVKEQEKKYVKGNKDKVNILTNLRRARMRLLPYTFTINQWCETKIYFKQECCYCGKELPLQMEHFIPVTKGGGYVKENIVCACHSCNSSKLNYDFFTWYPMQKYYSKIREQRILEYINYNKRLTSTI